MVLDAKNPHGGTLLHALSLIPLETYNRYIIKVFLWISLALQSNITSGVGLGVLLPRWQNKKIFAHIVALYSSTHLLVFRKKYFGKNILEHWSATTRTICKAHKMKGCHRAVHRWINLQPVCVLTVHVQHKFNSNTNTCLNGSFSLGWLKVRKFLKSAPP